MTVCRLIRIVFCAALISTAAASQSWAFVGPMPSSFAVTTDTLSSPDDFVRRHRSLRTAAGILAINQMVWSYNRFVREGGTDEQFRVNWGSFSQNVNDGFVWDDNDFWTNHFYHPAHGSFYYEVARANGFNYWQSAAWTMLGSWHWEHAGEANTPSLNDLINTTVGGVALGEPLFRLAGVVLDNQARGGERFLREIGGFMIAPGRGLNRLMSGEAFHVHGNASGASQRFATGELRLGYRSMEMHGPATPGTRLGFVEASIRYGAPFSQSNREPFDHFDFDLMFNARDDRHKIGKIRVAGIVAGRTFGDPLHSQHVFACFQHFEYYDNPAYEFGSQSLSASVLGRYPIVSSLELRSGAHLKGVLLGATRADYGTTPRRSYDYGSGVGYEVSLAIAAGGRDYVTVGRGQTFIHSLHGSDADHLVGFTTLQLRAPVLGLLSAGADLIHYDANRDYRTFPDVRARHTEVRTHLSWVFD